MFPEQNKHLLNMLSIQNKIIEQSHNPQSKLVSGWVENSFCIKKDVQISTSDKDDFANEHLKFFK